MDPATIMAGMQLLSAAGGKSGGGSASQPSNITSGNAPSQISNDLDFSGWTVATSGAKASGANVSKSKGADGLGMDGASISAALSGINPWLVVGGVVAVGLLVRFSR